MTRSESCDLDAKIARLVGEEQQVTLNGIGGIDAVPESWASSPMFPYVANAVVSEWGTLSDSQHEHSSGLFVAAITKTNSALALNDTCLAVVPSAVDLGIAMSIKDALHRKATARSTDSQAALAVISIRWLAHLAVNTHTARPALIDLLAGVGARSQGSEPLEFAIAAAQVAGIAHDFWRDQNAWECLERLTDTDAEADAWFGLGQAQLVKALEADSQAAVMAGLSQSLECFSNAKNAGEDRPDAKLYVHIIRFVRELANEAPPEMLQEHVEGAESALREYILLGSNLPELPMWLRPRYTTENAWMLAIGRLHLAREQTSGHHSWYRPALVIGALSDAYLAANALRLSRHVPEGMDVGDTFAQLVAPQLVAPFIEKAERLAFVDEWLSESDSPDADAFARLVREAAERHLARLGEEATDAQVVPPKHHPPGNARR